MDARALPRPAPGTAVVTVGDETVVSAASTGRTVRLNAVASTLWACLDGTATSAAIAADVAAVTGRDLRGVERDLRQLVRHWEQLGLLSDARAPAPAPEHRHDAAALRRITVPPDE